MQQFYFLIDPILVYQRPLISILFSASNSDAVAMDKTKISKYSKKNYFF